MSRSALGGSVPRIDEPLMCPSAPCKEGAVLLGVVGSDGRVGYLKQRVHVDSDFVRIAREGRSPEKRFRFSLPCVQSGCGQWKEGRCGVPDKVLPQTRAPELHEKLPACTIRPECRWFAQEGASACVGCSEVVTDLT